MIVERSREYTVNMGNYESLKIGAKVTVDVEETETKTLEGASEFADKALTNLLEGDVKEARELTHVRDSYILSWKTE